MTDDRIPITIMRVPITTPCPVKVTPDGRTLDQQGEVLPDEARTELCAVDAQWMIGTQRVCDVHLRLSVDVLGAIEGSFEDVVREAFLPFGEDACTRAIARAFEPWDSRKRYSQADAEAWL